MFDSLGTRMKENYESITKTRLVRRTPVIIRVDGKAFHTFTRGFKLPYDEVLMNAMNATMLYMCKHIQGTQLGYVQSDEISLLLVDYERLSSCAYFDNEVQKICSISASMATAAFTHHFREYATADGDECYIKALGTYPMFDSRVFNIPKEEVTNYFYWRQLDATRNSIQAAGQTYFSHKELYQKNTSQIQDMLMLQHNVNWNNFPEGFKRGRCAIKDESGWVLDTKIPIFKSEGRDYVDSRVYIGEGM